MKLRKDWQFLIKFQSAYSAKNESLDKNIQKRLKYEKVEK